MERDVEALEVTEDPAAQLQQHLLADPARAAQEEHPAGGLHQHDGAQRRDDQQEFACRTTVDDGRDAVVDAALSVTDLFGTP